MQFEKPDVMLITDFLFYCHRELAPCGIMFFLQKKAGSYSIALGCEKFVIVLKNFTVKNLIPLGIFWELDDNLTDGVDLVLCVLRVGSGIH